jgi:hypothetical protein
METAPSGGSHLLSNFETPYPLCWMVSCVCYGWLVFAGVWGGDLRGWDGFVYKARTVTVARPWSPEPWSPKPWSSGMVTVSEGGPCAVRFHPHWKRQGLRF